jgi:hypothetical protein
LTLNTFEISILRILAKKQNAIRISSLIDGFPDCYIDSVLQAISNLNYQGYISFFNDNNSSEVRVLLNKDKRKEVLKIIDPLPNPIFAGNHAIDMEKGGKIESYYFSDKSPPIDEQEKNRNKKGETFLQSIKYIILPHHKEKQYTNAKKSSFQPLVMRSVITLSLVVLGFVSILGMAEFAGDNYYPTTIDRTSLNYHTNILHPAKYQWHFDKEYLREMNSSSSSAFIPPGHIEQASYPCSHGKGYSYS